jgi:hypothetical protein
MGKTCIPYLASEVTPEEIFGLLTLKIYDENLLWDRNVYNSFTQFMFGKLQNIIRGIARKTERQSGCKNKNKSREPEDNKCIVNKGRNLIIEDKDLIEGEEENDIPGECPEDNNGESDETEIADMDDEEMEDYECGLSAEPNRRKGYVEPSISLNINLIGKKLRDDSDPYNKYEDSFTAQFNRAEFGNIVEEILVDPADTELLALYVGKYVEEKRREEIMEEYKWTEKEYNALYKRLLYKLSVCLPGRFREMVVCER